MHTAVGTRKHYFLVAKNVLWETAQHSCQLLIDGAHLLAIRSALEQQEVALYLNSLGCQYIVIVTVLLYRPTAINHCIRLGS